MNRNQFIEFITKIGFYNINLENSNDYFKYSNDKICCYITFLREDIINIFVIDILTNNMIFTFNGNEFQILKDLKKFLKRDIRDISLNDIINS